MDGDLPASLHGLFQCLTVLSLEKIFLNSQCKLPVVLSEAIALVLLFIISEKE